MNNEQTLREWANWCDQSTFQITHTGIIADWWLEKLSASHQQIFERLKAELPKEERSIVWKEMYRDGYNHCRRDALAVIDRVEKEI